MNFRLAVIQFPGSNCEYETARAASANGFDAEILRWNAPAETFRQFQAYILPGGFSFQDRVRSGAIASKLPVLGLLQEAGSEGKPILGICNGCQILAEAGLIPDFDALNAVGVAMMPNAKKGEQTGFICDWLFVKIQNPKQNVFTSQFEEGEVLPIPINHGEGRFRFEQGVQDRLAELARLSFCSATGEVSEAHNPNGAALNLAGIGNAKGNVLAMMPHPERASFLRQIPFWIEGDWSQKKRLHFLQGEDAAGPWSKLFLSLKKSLAENLQRVGR